MDKLANKLLSIITINYNNCNGLKNTIDSVVDQTFNNYEFIIIDGGSTDGSRELIVENANHISVWVSEKDEGIYDAMNKGIKKASGTWILFLNSGDILYQNNTLDLIFSNSKLSKYDVLYGGVIRIEDKAEYFVEPSELCTFFYKMPFCHQSSIVKRDVISKNGFNCAYKIAADFDFFCQAYRKNKQFKRLDIFISVFEEGGISSNNKELMCQEFEQISLKYFRGFLRSKLYLQYRLGVLKRKVKSIATRY